MIQPELLVSLEKVNEVLHADRGHEQSARLVCGHHDVLIAVSLAGLGYAGR